MMTSYFPKYFSYSNCLLIWIKFTCQHSLITNFSQLILRANCSLNWVNMYLIIFMEETTNKVILIMDELRECILIITKIVTLLVNNNYPTVKL